MSALPHLFMFLVGGLLLLIGWACMGLGEELRVRKEPAGGWTLSGLLLVVFAALVWRVA